MLPSSIARLHNASTSSVCNFCFYIMCCSLILIISDNISCAALALSVLRKSSSFYCLQPSFIQLKLDQLKRQFWFVFWDLPALEMCRDDDQWHISLSPILRLSTPISPAICAEPLFTCCTILCYKLYPFSYVM